MIWLIGILKTYLEEHHLIRYYVIKYLVLLRIQTMMDTKVILLQWLTNFLIKSAGIHAGTAINSNSDFENQQPPE